MKAIIILLFIMLCGCAAKPYNVGYKCPKIIFPPDPAMPALMLNDRSSNDEIIKAWVATGVGLRNWNKIVRRQVESY